MPHLARPERLLSALALGDVADHDSAGGRAIAVLGAGRLQTDPEKALVLLQEPEVIVLRRACLEELPAASIVTVLVVGQDETGQGLVDKFIPCQPEQTGRREIGFEDHPLVADGEVPNGGRIIYVEVTCTRRI